MAAIVCESPAPMDSLTPSEAPTLLADYLQAWDRWRHSQPVLGRRPREASVQMYGHMWAALTAWGVAHGRPLYQLRAADLAAYLHSRAADQALTPRYAWRLVRLVERVLTLHGQAHGLPPNTAGAELMAERPDIRYANASALDTLPDCLEPAQAAQLLRWLMAPYRTAAGEERVSDWQALRNRAAVALHLGAGLTPGDLRRLTLGHLRYPGPAELEEVAQAAADAVPVMIRVPASGNAAPHDTPVLPWAGRLVAHWLHCRQALHIPGEQLFVSTRSSGKPWGKVAHYEAVKKVLLAAGIAAVEGGSYRLRHTFALRQLRRGHLPEQVRRWLGVSDPDVMQRYLRLLEQLDDALLDSTAAEAAPAAVASF